MFLWQMTLALHCWELSYRSSVRVSFPQPGEFYWVRTRKSEINYVVKETKWRCSEVYQFQSEKLTLFSTVSAPLWKPQLKDCYRGS